MNRELKISISFRLSSDDSRLFDIEEMLDIKPKAKHKKGHLIDRTSIVAKSNYIATDNYPCASINSVDCVLNEIITNIESSELAVQFLKSKEVSATLWISILPIGNSVEEADFPQIEKSTLVRSNNLNIVIFSENYTKYEEGNPAKRFYNKIS